MAGLLHGVVPVGLELRLFTPYEAGQKWSRKALQERCNGLRERANATYDLARLMPHQGEFTLSEIRAMGERDE
jgi:hypothetical protein